MDKSNTYLLGIVIAPTAAFVCGLAIYGPLASLEFDFAFFEEFSVKKITSDWFELLRICFAALYGLLTAVSFHHVAKHSKVNPIWHVPLSMVFGGIGIIFLAILAGIIIIILAVIALFIALFFGRGDA